MRTLKTIIKTVILTIVVLIAAGLIYMYSGAYDIGQDVPHNALTHWLLHEAREHSIANHDADVNPPALNTVGMVANGAHVYSSHCSGCHLAPGKSKSAIRDALYPRPPHLAKATHIDPKLAFWVIKHGIKFTAMPAWGTSLSDDQIWNVVAFLEKQPTLGEVEYQSMLNGPVTRPGPTPIPAAPPTPPPADAVPPAPPATAP